MSERTRAEIVDTTVKAFGQAAKRPVVVFGNYSYSITQDDQQEIQLFLRALPAKWRQHMAWHLLHLLTHTKDWTVRKPAHEVITCDETGKVVADAAEEEDYRSGPDFDEYRRQAAASDMAYFEAHAK